MIDFRKIFADSEKVNIEVKAAQGGVFRVAFGKLIRLSPIHLVGRLFSE